MTKVEKELLENILDGLDRLFDRETGAIEIYTLIFAASKALSDTEYFSILDRTANELNEILHSKLNVENERDASLKATNDLRHFLAEILDF